jgi:hypothetical protein
MASTRRYRYVQIQVGALLAVALALEALDALTLELFFLLGLLVFLAVTDLTAPTRVTPAWRTRLRWVFVAGMAVLLVFLVRLALAHPRLGPLVALINAQSRGSYPPNWHPRRGAEAARQVAAVLSLDRRRRSLPTGFLESDNRRSGMVWVAWRLHFLSYPRYCVRYGRGAS